MSLQNSSLLQSQLISPRISRMTSKNYEETKESDFQKNSCLTPRPFQRKSSKAFSRKKKILNQHQSPAKQVSPLPLNDIRLRGLVTISSLSSLKNFKAVNQEDIRTSNQKKRSRNFIPQTPRIEKVSEGYQKQGWQVSNYCNEKRRNAALLQQMNSLKQFNQILQKHNKVLIQKNQRYKDQIGLMTFQIQQLNNTIDEKNQKIKTLSQNLEEQKNCAEDQKEVNVYLEDIVIDLNKKLESLNSETQGQSIVLQDKAKIEELQDQVQKLKEENIFLKEKIKYSSIQNNMMKKTQYELEKQQKFLDNKNKKLKARIDSLQNVKKNIPIPQLKKFNRILQNSLSFSIEY